MNVHICCRYPWKGQSVTFAYLKKILLHTQRALNISTEINASPQSVKRTEFNILISNRILCLNPTFAKNCAVDRDTTRKLILIVQKKNAKIYTTRPASFSIRDVRGEIPGTKLMLLSHFPGTTRYLWLIHRLHQTGNTHTCLGQDTLREKYLGYNKYLFGNCNVFTKI